MKIHSTAIIDKHVELADDVEVGPFTIITGHVKIDKGTVIGSHVSIGNPYGRVFIGQKNQILPGAMVGGPPQDVSYKNEPTELHIGDGNLIREFTTLNCGTVKGGGKTKIGNNCMLMAYVHVAHDCVLNNNVIIANSTQLAGHVEIDDFVRVGGMVGLVQFVKIGKYAYIGGGAHINKDIIPYSIAEGNWAKVRAMNKVGLQRAGFKKEDIDDIYKAIKFLIMGDRTVDEALKLIESECGSSESIKYLVNFIKSSENGVAR